MGKFKAGGKVGVKHSCSGCIPGGEYILQKGVSGLCSAGLFASNRVLDKIGKGCSCENNWVKLKSPVKSKVTNPLVSFLENLKVGETKEFDKYWSITKVPEGFIYVTISQICSPVFVATRKKNI